MDSDPFRTIHTSPELTKARRDDGAPGLRDGETDWGLLGMVIGVPLLVIASVIIAVGLLA